MNLAQVKELVIPEGEVRRIEKDGTVLWKSGHTNRVSLSINEDGSIYNGGLGYKDGYRVRSGGAEGEHGGCSCTGYIPVSGGDVVRIYPVNADTLSASGNAINVYDASFTHLGQAASNSNYGIFKTTYSAYSWGNACVSEGGGIYRWTVPPAAAGVAYIRLSLYDNVNGAPGAKMILTINEEIGL